MRHVIVSRFSVPRIDSATADRHLDRQWIDRRLDLFRRYFVPSVDPLGVPAILLCSSASSDRVAQAVADLEWATVSVQDDWYGGWRGAPDQFVTRLDSDDAIRGDWFEHLDAAPTGFGAYCSRRFLRLDLDSGRLYGYRRREPSPLAAFPGGANPYLHDHADLERHFRVYQMPEAYLLQVVHGGNVSNRRPSWRRYFNRLPRERLAAFGARP